MISNLKKALNVVLEENEIYIEYNLNPVAENSSSLSLATLSKEIRIMKQKFFKQDKINTLTEQRTTFSQ